MHVSHFLTNLLMILVSAKLFGKLAECWKQPAVLGELFGGVLLGTGVVSFFHPNDPGLSLAAEAGVILLLLETGLDSDLKQLLKAGPVSFAVACVGVVLPFLLGVVVMRGLGHASLPAVLVGAALTATSIGITARVLTDIGKLQTPEGQIILGAAVIDDILGIILLAVVQRQALSGPASWGQAVGSVLIVGAFMTGILLAQTPRKEKIHSFLKPAAGIFVPIFFVMVGAKVDLRPFNPFVAASAGLYGLVVLLIGVAVIGKLASGWAVWTKGVDRLSVGIGMIPRGEVGLIFAQVGLASGVIQGPLYSALIAMVVVTTFITPPLLKKVLH